MYKTCTDKSTHFSVPTQLVVTGAIGCNKIGKFATYLGTIREIVLFVQ